MEVLIGVIVVIMFITVLRELYCWYSKINERIALLEKQFMQTKETNLLLRELITISQGEKKSQKGYVSASSGVKIDINNQELPLKS